MYLFQPRPAGDRSISNGETVDPGAVPSTVSLHDALPGINTSAIQPGSAAEWAIGELLIRLCNRGRALRPEPREEQP